MDWEARPFAGECLQNRHRMPTRPADTGVRRPGVIKAVALVVVVIVAGVVLEDVCFVCVVLSLVDFFLLVGVAKS